MNINFTHKRWSLEYATIWFEVLVGISLKSDFKIIIFSLKIEEDATQANNKIHAHWNRPWKGESNQELHIETLNNLVLWQKWKLHPANVLAPQCQELHCILMQRCISHRIFVQLLGMLTFYVLIYVSNVKIRCDKEIIFQPQIYTAKSLVQICTP